MFLPPHEPSESAEGEKEGTEGKDLPQRHREHGVSEMIKFQISDPDKSRPSLRVRRIGAPPNIVPAANVRK